MPDRQKSKSKSKSAVAKEVDISKGLSYLLRHGAKNEGVRLDEGGWANVADVLAWRRIASLKVDLPQLQYIVATNDKKRYQIAPDPAGPLCSPSAKTTPTSASEPANWRIRATQGHSITTVSSEQIFTPILLTDADCPSFVVHGTDLEPWRKIKKSGGLKPMGRNHIHFATWLPATMPDLNPDFQSLSKPKAEPGDNVISGMRNTSLIMIWADVKKSLAAGVKWWRSENGVILTEGVGEPKMLGFEFIKWVEWRGKDEILYGSRVESDEVREMETKMDRVGVGLGDGGEVSQDTVDPGKAPQERVSGERALQEKPVNGHDKPEPAAAVKDRWDD